MKKFEGVSNTLFVPLVARIYVSKHFPEFFYDQKCLELERYLPEGASQGAYEYSHIASSTRYFNLDTMTRAFITQHPNCNIVHLGVGLDTSYDRYIAQYDLGQTHWYGLDLPDVIDARKKVLGQRPQETLLAADMFDPSWMDRVDSTRPTLFIASGVFQYFDNKRILRFIAMLRRHFYVAELIFDALSSQGLKFSNRFIKKTGNTDSFMCFSVDDPGRFAHISETRLVRSFPFFREVRAILGKKVRLSTRASMWVNDKLRQTIIVHLRL